MVIMILLIKVFENLWQVIFIVRGRLKALFFRYAEKNGAANGT